MNKSLLITCLTLFIVCNMLFAGTSNNKTALSNPGVVNDTLTATFSVNGNASCKSSIEGSLTANTGVISANWTAGTQSITVSYLSAKLKLSDLYSLLANAGYDNVELRAKDAVYAALPTACQYTRQPVTE
jgi:hypothetical protein